MLRYIEIVDIAFRYRCIESYRIGLGRFNNFFDRHAQFLFSGVTIVGHVVSHLYAHINTLKTMNVKDNI